MPRPPDPNGLQKHTLSLYEGDYERLRTYYPEVGAAAIIRKLVRIHLDKLDQRAPVPQVTVDLEI